MGFLSVDALAAIGFREIGEDVLISEKASIYNPANISIGSRTRIDDFCILSAGSGGIEIGSNVHIACYTSLIGDAAITMEDFSGLSGRVSVYSSSDNYLGSGLTNPTIPTEYRSIKSKEVLLCRHSLVGTGAVILPGSILREGAAIGALAMVQQECESFFLYVGNPLEKRTRRRKDKILKLEKQYLESLAKQ